MTNSKSAQDLPLLQIIVASTRPTRIGMKVAEWFQQEVEQNGLFTSELIDLKEIDLPALDEPKHPRLQDYQNTHTKEFSKLIDRADAYAFVIPEYNFFAPPALINALNYLLKEWAYKPAALVSYGGVSAGLRSAQAMRQILPALKMMPLPEAVSIPFVHGLTDDDGLLIANEAMTQGAAALLEELARWERALRELRRDGK